ncbi:MAG: fumarylacetoacetate hydrolase family protein, partial [Gammaproteobacteria bacterium]
MKLASVRIGDRDAIAVEYLDSRVIELGALLGLAPTSGIRAPRSMRELIDSGRALLDAIEATLHEAEPDDLAAPATVPDAWYPPVRRPGKILAVAMNNSASNARKISAPEHPAFFLKPASCLIGHGAPIRIRPYYGSVHPEPELALVIGTRARDLSPETALDAVFGYTIMNDITSNGMRAEDRFHYWAIYADPNDPDKTEPGECGCGVPDADSDGDG